MNILMLLKPKCDVAYLYEDNTIRQGLEKMRYHGYTAIPVINRDGSYAGTVSEGDFLWNMLDERAKLKEIEEKTTVCDILKKERNPAVRINTNMDELLLKVMDQNFVPVTDDRGVFMGIVTRRDIIKYFYKLLYLKKDDE
ncbi:MAG: CBS domain-containing protein [Acutalibacteraceae bacterium]